MTDNIEEMGKDDLIAYAELHGVEIDKRWNAARIREAIAGADGAAPVADTDAIEMTAPEAPQVADASPGAFNLDSAVSVWAESFAKDIKRAFAEFDGDVFQITLETRHGLTITRIADVDDAPDSIMAALEMAKAEMIGGE